MRSLGSRTIPPQNPSCWCKAESISSSHSGQRLLPFPLDGERPQRLHSLSLTIVWAHWNLTTYYIPCVNSRELHPKAVINETSFSDQGFSMQRSNDSYIGARTSREWELSSCWLLASLHSSMNLRYVEIKRIFEETCLKATVGWHLNQPRTTHTVAKYYSSKRMTGTRCAMVLSRWVSICGRPGVVGQKWAQSYKGGLLSLICLLSALVVGTGTNLQLSNRNRVSWVEIAVTSKIGKKLYWYKS